MAQTQYRINLSAKDFVFLASQWGRSVILKQYDQNFSRQIVSPTDPDKDIGIPQIFYCHNVMPAAQGFQSIGFNQITPSIPGVGNIGEIFSYKNSDGTQGFFAVAYTNTAINFYALPLGSTAWIFVQSVATTSGFQITTANVNGQTYIYIPVVGCYTYNPTGNALVAVTLTGLTPTQIIGITDSFGYMIAWSSTTVAWSSTITPTDFTPSLITGAGGGGVQGIKGAISVCVHHVFGFVVYCDVNAVAAVYSGNARFPFNFREITGAGGLTQPTLVTTDSESGNQYAYTTSGLQLISVTQGTIVFPELTNFLGGGRFEDFNETTLQFIETTITPGSMIKNITVVNSRYFVLSYGIGTFYTHALVYDIGMKRWGKIRINHIQAFQFHGNGIDFEESRTTLGFIDPTGMTSIVDFSMDSASTHGVMLLGKYQHVRNRMITLEEIDPETLQSNSAQNLQLYIMPTLDGKTFTTPVPCVQKPGSNPLAPVFNCRTTGLNLSLLFIGAFNMDSCVLSYTPNGRR